jgi:5'-nucleotidase
LWTLGSGPELVDRRHLAPGATAFVAASLVALLGLRAVAGTPEPRSQTARIQILGSNDLHGYLQPTGDLGGAAWFAAAMDRDAAGQPKRTIRVHAGDMIGASPLISSYFHHRSTIAAIDRMHFDVGTVGNHEFDDGGDRLTALLRRVRFPYISANVVDREGKLRLPSYRIVERDGVKIGFIGVTTPTATRYLLPRFARRFRFLDMSDSVNRWVPALRRRGVESIVVLAHSGAFQQGGPRAPAAGEIIDETRQMDDAVDLVIAGHTHSYLNTRVKGKLVVQAYSYGTAIDRVELRIDRHTDEVVASTAGIQRVRHAGLRPDPAVAAIVGRYARRVRPVADRVVAMASRGLPRGDDGLGDLVARAQRSLAHAEFAFVNPGNMRASLQAGAVTYGELCSINAYGHPIMRLRLYGRDVAAVLQQQWSHSGTTRLYTSGIRYRHDGGRVTDVTGARGLPLDPGRLYTVAANELIATGSRFSVLRDRGKDKRRVGTDVQALAGYLHREPGALR